jgi:hypothetical protein
MVQYITDIKQFEDIISGSGPVIVDLNGNYLNWNLMNLSYLYLSYTSPGVALVRIW